MGWNEIVLNIQQGHNQSDTDTEMSFRDWITHCADILSGEVDGNVTGHVIGVSVASGWMDLDRDFDNVSSFDNQVNLSSSEISLPSISILPGGG